MIRADPDTKAWLDSHLDPVFGYPGIVRFSWQTCESLLTQHGVPFTWYAESSLSCETAKGHDQSRSFKLAASNAVLLYQEKTIIPAQHVLLICSSGFLTGKVASKARVLLV